MRFHVFFALAVHEDGSTLDIIETLHIGVTGGRETQVASKRA